MKELDMRCSVWLSIVCIALLAQGCRHCPPLPTEEPEPYGVVRTSEPITIDGRLDEDAWTKAAPLAFIKFKVHTLPISKTEGKMLWDDSYLYVGFEAADKDIWSYLDKHDQGTCREDCLEIFFNTDPETNAYYNFEINAKETVFDAFSPKMDFAGNYHRWARWNCPGLLVKTVKEGTLNNPDDMDSGWSMEVAIPFESLPSMHGKAPHAGDEWSFHLSRYDYSVYLPDNGVEVSSCAPLTLPFKDPTGWMTLRFAQ